MTGLARGRTFSALRHNIAAVRTALAACGTADSILDDFRPDLVIGVGGYISWPVVRRAAKRGIKTMIHEQNTFPGITTKMLAPRVDMVLLPNKKSGERIKGMKASVVVGNPVRDDFIFTDREAARRSLGIPDGEFLIVSAGGSLGARVFNEIMAGVFAMSSTLPACRFIHSTGRGWYGGFCAMLGERHVRFNSANPRITAVEYIDNMPVLLRAADLAVSRAGASTLAELAVCQTPAVLVPSPNVTENHQYHNAKLIEQHGAAVVLTEDALNSQLMYDTIKDLISDPARLEKMRRCQKELAVYDVCERIYGQIMALAGREK